jgi:hypothetical protein
MLQGWMTIYSTTLFVMRGCHPLTGDHCTFHSNTEGAAHQPTPAVGSESYHFLRGKLVLLMGSFLGLLGHTCSL